MIFLLFFSGLLYPCTGKDTTVLLSSQNPYPLVNGIQSGLPHKPSLQAFTSWHSLSTHAGNPNFPNPTATTPSSHTPTPTPTAEPFASAPPSSSASPSADPVTTPSTSPVSTPTTSTTTNTNTSSVLNVSVPPDSYPPTSLFLGIVVWCSLALLLQKLTARDPILPL